MKPRTMGVRDYLERIKSDATAALAMFPPAPEPPDGDGVLVRAGENLQAALDAGGVVGLEPGAIFEGAYRLHVSGTRLAGSRAGLAGPAHGPALTIPPGTRDVQAVLDSAISAWDDTVIQVGAGDDTQTHVDDVPRDIVLTITVPTHRGKRAFNINAADVLLDGCNAYDVYDPAGRDSQGILIWNTPGPVHVRGGVFQAGSECLLVGGDATAIPDVCPSDLLFEDCEFSRPLAWKGDGVSRKVKNCFELKAGIGVILRRARLAGCWIDGQTGYAFMITPRNGKTIRDVVIEDTAVADVGNTMMISGYDDEAYSAQVVGVTLRRVDAASRDDEGFGAGRFVQWISSPRDLVVEGCHFDGPGTTLHCDPGKTWADPNTPGESGITYGVRFCNNAPSLRSYGFMLNGYAYARDWQDSLPDGVIEGNVFHGVPASQLKHYQATLPPSNTYSVERGGHHGRGPRE